MPRTARKKSKTGIYHIVLRGVNRQTIFEDNEDAEKFLQTLKDYKDKSGYKIYAYCLMGNHIHPIFLTV
jgi:REP element-mobilizing transposase RayT